MLHVLEPKGMGEQEREIARFVARQRLSALLSEWGQAKSAPVLLIRGRRRARQFSSTIGFICQDVLVRVLISMAPRLLTDSIVRRVIVESQCPVITIGSHWWSVAEWVDTSAGANQP